MERKSKNKRSALLDVARHMPALRRTPQGRGTEYHYEADEVLAWIREQPDLQQWLLGKLQSRGYIKYDPERHVWLGVQAEDA